MIDPFEGRGLLRPPLIGAPPIGGQMAKASQSHAQRKRRTTHTKLDPGRIDEGCRARTEASETQRRTDDDDRVGVEVRQTIWTKRTARPSARPSSEDGGRPETMMRMLQARYPGMTASQLPSLTAAFVLLHELTALVPMVVIFGIVQVTGTGARLVQAIRDALPPSPPSPQDPHQHPAPSENTSLAASLSAAIDNSALKVSKIAHKYGYDSAEDDAGEDDDEGKSMLDNGVLASGLVAYLAVKVA
ncbi:hypothetical protein PtB15_9B494 [Puccinia triticina]|nr:hypothetical protein PtB15_9B494 [Puccinia triticina]